MLNPDIYTIFDFLGARNDVIFEGDLQVDGAMTIAGLISTGTIQANAFTDGTATLTGGALSGVTTINTTDVITVTMANNSRLYATATNANSNAGVIFTNDAQKYDLQVQGSSDDKFSLWDSTNSKFLMQIEPDTGSVSFLGNATVGGQTLSSNGAVGAPAFSFASDTDTGMYRVGSNLLGFSNGGVLAMYFDASHNGLFQAGATFASDVTVGGSILLKTSGRGVFQNTTDGVDNRYTVIGGGGAESVTRGAFIQLSGNEAPSAGQTRIYAGAGGGSDGTRGQIQFKAYDNSEVLILGDKTGAGKLNADFKGSATFASDVAVGGNLRSEGEYCTLSSDSAPKFVIQDSNVNATGEYWQIQNNSGNFRIQQSTDAGGGYASLVDRFNIDRLSGDVVIGGITLKATGAVREIYSHSSSGALRVGGGTSTATGAYMLVGSSGYGSGNEISITATGGVVLGATTSLTVGSDVEVGGNIVASSMPTSNPGAGILWNDGGTIKMGT